MWPPSLSAARLCWGCGGDGRNAEHDDGDDGGDDLFHDGFLSEWLGVVGAGEFMDCVFQKLFGNALIKF